MIDLHTHTNYSDGACSPEELLELAAKTGLRAIAITDHDSLAGFDYAAGLPRLAGLELLCGIELTCRLGLRTAHLLGYFLEGAPAAGFLEWLRDRWEQRRDRNRRLARRLQELGMPVELEEAEALGKFMTGRPHFARVLVAKGHAKSIDEAFKRFLGEDGIAYVRHEAPSLEETICRVNEAGGISSLAHPIRLRQDDDDAFIGTLARHDLNAIEVFHTDHSTQDRVRYLEIAKKYSLGVTGGSDFHGIVKPRVALGDARVEDNVLDDLRRRFVKPRE